MTQFEKDLYRLKILKKICEELDYDTSIRYALYDDLECAKSISEKHNEPFKKCLRFLYDKNYINFEKWMGGNYGAIRPLPAGIELIEKINRKAETREYENDFDKAAIEYIKSDTEYPNIILSVNIDNTITNINKIEKNLLDDDDKKTLISLLKEISENITKEKKESKVKKILTFLSDKSFQVILAVLPQVLESIGKG